MDEKRGSPDSSVEGGGWLGRKRPLTPIQKMPERRDIGNPSFYTGSHPSGVPSHSIFTFLRTLLLSILSYSRSRCDYGRARLSGRRTSARESVLRFLLLERERVEDSVKRRAIECARSHRTGHLTRSKPASRLNNDSNRRRRSVFCCTSNNIHAMISVYVIPLLGQTVFEICTQS